jgi:hypothetical protein
MVKRRGPPSQGWRTLLRNHAPDIAAMDLFIVPTIHTPSTRIVFRACSSRTVSADVPVVALGDDEGVSPEQKRSVFEQVKTNRLTIPEIAKHTDITVSAKQIRVSWKNGRQIVKTNRYDHAQPLTEFLLGEIARKWGAQPIVRKC